MDELTIEKIEKIAELTREYNNAVRDVCKDTDVGGDTDYIQIFSYRCGGIENVIDVFEAAGYPVSIDEHYSRELGGRWIRANATVNGVMFVSCGEKKAGAENEA